MHRPRSDRTDVVHQLTLHPLGHDAWRLCDRSVAESDARHLVAYAERLSTDSYEVTWVRGVRGVTRHPDIDDILRAAVERLQVRSISAGRKPDPIPHLPPMGVA